MTPCGIDPCDRREMFHIPASPLVFASGLVVVGISASQGGADSGRGQDRTLRGKALVECAIDGWS